MNTIVIPSVTNDGKGLSYFSNRTITLNGSEKRMLSEQISAKNFRLRTSSSDYHADWHVAGDPTLLIILAGNIRLTLRSSESKEFTTGDLFIAEDYLLPEMSFDTNLHGHTATVTGDTELVALHLKLEKRHLK